MLSMDGYTKSEIIADISRIDTLVNTGIFEPNNASNPFTNSAFIETIILLRDLVAKCKKFSTRINFTDDVIISSNVSDVTDLIVFIRNAVCHIDSDNNNIENNRITCSRIYGKGTPIVINGKGITSDYDDDVCYIFGEQKIYWRRHIIRAFGEARKRLLPLALGL